MTSAERKQLRYIRRKEKRQKKKEQLNKDHDCYEKVFSYEHLYQAYKKSKQNVSWKGSVQKHIIEDSLAVYAIYKKLKNGTFKTKGFFEFDIHERGKDRHIKSVTFSERVVQRCLCDNALVPVIKKSLIYDNSATLQFRGYHFAMKRLIKFLHQHYNQYKNNGYVLLFDFKKYFDNIPHAICKQQLKKYFSDNRIINLTEHFIDAFSTDKGLGLGSQISQIFAVAAANKLDHYIKQELHIKAYGRYMDDGYLIHNDKTKLQQCLTCLKIICKKLGIILNTKKTQIIKLGHGFTYLKTRIFITPFGKIIKKPPHKVISKERKKLKTFALKNFNVYDAYVSWQSWRSYMLNFNNWKLLQTIGLLYNRLFFTPSFIQYWELFLKTQNCIYS